MKSPLNHHESPHFPLVFLWFSHQSHLEIPPLRPPPGERAAPGDAAGATEEEVEGAHHPSLLGATFINYP